MARTPYCFSTLSFSCLKQASILSWNGLSASVTLSPWILIPSAKNGICKTQIRPPEFSVHGLGQRCPAPRPRTGTGPWPARNRAARQEASGGGDGEAPAALAAAPQRRPRRLGSFGVACSEERSPWGCPRRLGTAGRRGAGAGRGGSTGAGWEGAHVPGGRWRRAVLDLPPVNGKAAARASPSDGHVLKSGSFGFHTGHVWGGAQRPAAAGGFA